MSLCEHDHSNPEEFKEIVGGAVDKAAEQVVHGLGAVPVLGPTLAVIAEVAAFVIGGPEVKKEITHFLGTQEDHLETISLSLPAKELLRLAFRATQPFEGIPAHIERPLTSGQDSSYKAYFRVQEARA